MFCELNHVSALGAMLHTADYKLQLLAYAPKYRCFSIRKSNGGFRNIEDPDKSLKLILTRLNKYLQCVYYLQRPPNVYGFTISASGDEDRNIVSNAQRHVGCKYMVNIDLRDFFHQVKESHVEKIFQKLLKRGEEKLIELLTRLVCYQGRLPMGSPCSPVLSNFASEEMDLQLVEYVHRRGFTYTRYADDLTFSCKDFIESEDVELIRHLIGQAGFIINEDKVRHYGAGELKTVTGLVVGETEVGLPDDYYTMIRKEVDRYCHFYEVDAKYMTGASFKKMRSFERELRGKLQFGLMVDPGKAELLDHLFRMDHIIEQVQHFETVSWLDIPYLDFQ